MYQSPLRYTVALLVKLTLILCISLSTAHAAINPLAKQVEMQLDCAGADDCFTNWDDLSTWITGTRHPTETTPLSVDIGPGEFIDSDTAPGQWSTSMLLDCATSPATGWISFKGAGREITKLTGNLFVALWIRDCESLEFQDLSVSGTLAQAVGWLGAGSSTWTNVDFSGFDLAWSDYCDFGGSADAVAVVFVAGGGTGPVENKSEHYYHNIKMKSGTFTSYCAINWIYASDLAKEVSNDTRPAAINVNHQGDIRLFGSTVRSWSDGSAFPVEGINIGSNGHFHMHGGIINVDSTAGTGNATAIKLENSGSLAHVIDTAFVVKSKPTAQTLRIDNPGLGKVMSPFLWQPGNDAPGVNLASETGQDMFVEKDCDSSGDCSGSCSTNASEICQPHIMVYSDACTAVSGTPWFDSTVNQCRQN